MSRNAPMIILSTLVVLLAVTCGLLFRAYREAATTRLALEARVEALEGDVATGRERIVTLESAVGTLTEEAARLHEENERMHRSGTAFGKGS